MTFPAFSECDYSLAHDLAAATPFLSTSQALLERLLDFSYP